MVRSQPLGVGQLATMACLLDVTAPKPGNVHRGADFDDVTFWDFAASAVAIGPVLEDAVDERLGVTILRAIQATRSVTKSNTNLGIVLLLAPLASISPNESTPQSWEQAIARILSQLTPQDAVDTYQAIRLAQPGGMGETSEWDVARHAPPNSLLDAMRAAADRDSVARQYVENFSHILGSLVPRLISHVARWGTIPGIVASFVEQLANSPDSLIQRKLGREFAIQVSARADRVWRTLQSGDFFDDVVQAGLRDLDFWLRADGNKRNPGTTADLITAAVFVGLRWEGIPLVLCHSLIVG